MAVKTDPTESLRRVPLFAGMDKKELDLVARLLKEQPYSAGTIIVKSGSGGHGLYIIKEGRVTVVREGQAVATLTYKMLLEMVKRLRSQSPHVQD